MKRLIASDLHGSRAFCRKLLDLYEKEQATELILLGDLAFSGSYDPRFEFDPQGVMDLLNRQAPHILSVEGNCDYGIQELSPQFPFFRKYKVVTWEGREVFLTHGHRYSPRNPPPMGMAQILLSGHTHMPSFQRVNDLLCVNPGSVSLPRGGSPNSCLVWEGDLLRWLTLEGEEFHRETLSK